MASGTDIVERICYIHENMREKEENMQKILFVNGNLKGHFNPTLPVVTELVSRGEEVWYFASEIFKEELESAGAHFISSVAEIEEFNKNFRSSGNHPFYTLLEYKLKYDIAMVPVLLNRIQNLSFDVLVYDSYLGRISGCNVCGQ